MDNAEALIKKATNKIVREISYHFKVDKWPLSWAGYTDDIIYEAFGVNVDSILLKKLESVGLDIKIEDGNVLIIRRKRCRKK